VDTRQPDVRIHAFLDAHHVTFYLDTSGEALFKRGWRKSKGEAPLRENLAAGILLLAGYRRGRPLLDPMCGSGTLLMEAAMMALDIAPGLKRGFAFERLENFDAATFSRLREDALARRRPPERLPIWGSDVDPQAIEAARQNFLAAGLAGAVTLEQQDVLDIVPPAASGLLVTNPPYGERMGDAERLAALYPQLATVLKRRFPGWTACFLSSDLRLPKLMRLKPARRIPLMNGPLECRLFVFELVAGSHRRRGKDDTAPA
jgi:putative N6-adenine-specific DNA methylase